MNFRAKIRLKIFLAVTTLIIITFNLIFPDDQTKILDSSLIIERETELDRDIPPPKYFQNNPFNVSIYIRSAPDQLFERKQLRKCWVSELQENNVTVYFTIGASNSTDLDELLREEQNEFQDLLVFDSFVDNWRSLCLKTLNTIKFHLDNNRPDSIMMWSNMDTFIKPDKLLNYIETFVLSERNTKLGAQLFCDTGCRGLCAGDGNGVNRNKKSKFYIPPSFWKPNKWPHFCDGYTVLFGPHSLPPIYELAQNMSSNLLMQHLDDVLFTGILRKQAQIGLQIAPFRGFFTRNCVGEKCIAAHLRTINGTEHLAEVCDNHTLFEKEFLKNVV